MMLLLSLLQISIITCFLFSIAGALRTRINDCVIAVALSVLVICSIGMFQFWLALLFYPLSLLSKAITWLSVSVLFVHALWKQEFRHEIAVPILGFSLAAIVLAMWTHLSTDFSQPLAVAQTRWTHQLPIDNTLPFIFAGHLRSGAIPTPMIGDWLSSDRPPLQTGLYLLFGLPIGYDELTYQISSISVELLCLVGVWVLTRSLNVSAGYAILAIVITFFTPLVIVHGSYVWPKLISAGLMCITAACYFTPLYDRTRGSWLLGGSAGLSSAFAMLGHGASSFVLIAMALTALVLHRFARPNYLLTGVIAFGLMYTPWVAYQKYYDPPGNRLTKWHLLGAVDVDSRSLGDTAKDQLKSTSIWTWVDGRLRNFDQLDVGTFQALHKTGLAAKTLFIEDGEAASKILADVRISQFFSMVSGLGLIGLFTYLAPLGLISRKIRPLTTLFIMSLAVWVLLMFVPGSTVTHQGSMLPQLLLISGTIGGVSFLGFWPIVAVASVHIITTIFQYAS